MKLTSLWIDVVYPAIFTINCLPSPLLHDKSLHEVLSQRMPNYSFLKPFKCACFPYFVASFANKLQPRSTKCVFFGYAPHYKGYRCFDPRLGCILSVVLFDFTSRIFHTLHFHTSFRPIFFTLELSCGLLAPLPLPYWIRLLPLLLVLISLLLLEFRLCFPNLA